MSQKPQSPNDAKKRALVPEPEAPAIEPSGSRKFRRAGSELEYRAVVGESDDSTTETPTPAGEVGGSGISMAGAGADSKDTYESHTLGGGGSGISLAEEMPAPAGAGFSMKQPSITFVGSGQVACLIAGLIALQNRKLKEAGLPTVKISMLGREGSESLEAIKTKGITLKMAGEPDPIRINPDEFFATDNPDEITNQDHIFVALKTTAYEDEASCDKEIAAINKMKKPEGPSLEDRTTVTLAQNGIPCWFMSSIGKPEIELSTIGFSKKLIEGIGIENIVGCILNLACKVDSTPEGRPNYGTYHVATPRTSIGTPLDYIIDAGEQREKSLVSLQKILNSSGINTARKKMDLCYDLLMKLQVNIAINGLSAITGLSTAEMTKDPQLLKIIHALSTDISAIAHSPPTLNFFLREPEELDARIGVNATHTTSMGIDFNSGKQLEIGSIYEAVIEIASKLKLKTPKIIKNIVDVLKELVKLRDEEIPGEPNKRPIALCRELIKPQLDDLKEKVNLTFAPPSPTLAPRRISPTLTTPSRKTSVSYTSSGTSDDGESSTFNFENYESLTYIIDNINTSAETRHSKLTINAKEGRSPSGEDAQNALKSLCKGFIRDQGKGFERTYINGNERPRRVIKFSHSTNCILISHEGVFQAFRDWCKKEKNLEFNSAHQKADSSKSDIMALEH